MFVIRMNQRSFYFSKSARIRGVHGGNHSPIRITRPQRSTDPDALQDRADDAELVETVVQNFERLKQEGSGMSVRDQSVLVIHTLQSFSRDGTSLETCG